MIVQSMDYVQYLKEIYFNPSHPGSYSGAEKLYQTIKKEGKFKIGRNRIKQFLQNQEEYALQKDIKRKRKRRRIVVSGVDQQWAVDLANVESLEKSNNGIKYWLIVIDTFSKFLFIETLPSKKSTAVVQAFKNVLQSGRSPEVVYSDKGGEFDNFLFKRELKKRHIKYFTTQNEDVKTSIAERVIRTIRNKLYRYFQKQRSYRYIEVLPDLVIGYNKTKHRSLNNMAPDDINKDNEAIIWDHMYNDRQIKNSPINKKENEVINKSPIKNRKRISSKPPFKFKVDDYVRLAYSRYVFQRDYQQKWTTELFKVSSRELKENIPLYKVVDLLNEPVIGTFYEWELSKADKNTEFWRIESILKTRKKNGKKEYLIKWEGYSDKFSSWVPASDIKDLVSE